MGQSPELVHPAFPQFSLALTKALEALPRLSPNNPSLLRAADYVLEMTEAGRVVFDCMSRNLGLPPIVTRALVEPKR